LLETHDFAAYSIWEESALPASVLIICSDFIELAIMTGTLSENFAVLAAHDLDGAMRLLDHPNACRLAYYEAGDDAEATREGIHRLGNAGMEVVALYRPPCPQVVREAAVVGRIQGFHQLPMLPEALLAQTRELICRAHHPVHYDRPQSCLLTREEVKFLLGQELSCDRAPAYYSTES
jgi:hypothetical protein